ncbi:Fur-regulated basic protein FbpA [Halobacillus salinarum]|uniref:Fur-regulated basic protein FbpA n=1 Tax=Halobacillus salinarum TaxID=2932257 RepID=A0ABY4EHP1_9BACI|nr:Fur-regulated basic protein FbpA [Halobacillus salinarum]UOQ43989.1 Fur-regulated basic protein FbpA [Halobacillus salinarum]
MKMNYLRFSVEKMKQHYINRLVAGGVLHESDESAQSMTLTELEILVKNMDRSRSSTCDTC